MSAICGIVHRDGQTVETQTIDRIMTALDVYGPDGSSVWQQDSCIHGAQVSSEYPGFDQQEYFVHRDVKPRSHLSILELGLL